MVLWKPLIVEFLYFNKIMFELCCLPLLMIPLFVDILGWRRLLRESRVIGGGGVFLEMSTSMWGHVLFASKWNMNRSEFVVYCSPFLLHIHGTLSLWILLASLSREVVPGTHIVWCWLINSPNTPFYNRFLRRVMQLCMRDWPLY